MYRSALRIAPSTLRAARPILASGSRRFASTAPARKKGTWKGTALRWGLAAAAVYYYNTSPLFADELPRSSPWCLAQLASSANSEPAQVGPAPPHFSDADLPTVDALIEEKRRQAAAAAAAAPPLPSPHEPTKTAEVKAAEEKTDATAQQAKPTETEAAPTAGTADAPEPGSPEALEQEAQQQGAFDPETGEINWDCPCLGGMAHGPCGEEFKAAFSCFVYSKEEPKGMDCIDKFQHMQDCFRKYPDVYGSELADDEDDEAAQTQETQEAVKEVKGEEAVAQSKDEVTPPKAHDATEANKESKEVDKQ
ncbi:hypothetical protein MYCTH_2305597 [Thermothelomyces thermophilus ATCC 42464]|uniref:Mitochondrial intermembrane space import and assembly protein 40 n=1 Tax=Thermothelomyces thermophilus (strain ATCC 42464 / BCRC 31852 / DSM 1799) TaxID=573729 RepID=G2QDG7_THET4|nr:uncharacterized protein MYCTH_2305597 [Thermothelomyces thermophilus ATCC 42464]AEO58332.1 hypothetical protein MYCTH_2305597 [Thermothelomyces thermophilus ATCC 42464]